MTSASFDECLPFVLRWEGGYVNHPSDPGGAMNKGVTQAVYDRWRRLKGKAEQSVRSITDAEVSEIYESGYWRPPRCDELPRRLDLVHFDTAVNMGPGRAVRFLQTAVGCQVDGAFGPGTARAVNECSQDLGGSLARYCDTREAYYLRLIASNPKLAVFRRGWLNRLNALRDEVGIATDGPVPFGIDETERIERVPDIGVDPAYDV